MKIISVHPISKILLSAISFFCRGLLLIVLSTGIALPTQIVGIFFALRVFAYFFVLAIAILEKIYNHYGFWVHQYYFCYPNLEMLLYLHFKCFNKDHTCPREWSCKSLVQCISIRLR